MASCENHSRPVKRSRGRSFPGTAPTRDTPDCAVSTDLLVDVSGSRACGPTRKSGLHPLSQSGPLQGGGQDLTERALVEARQFFPTHPQLAPSSRPLLSHTWPVKCGSADCQPAVFLIELASIIMGSKKKSANPVEAARKAARAREVKKNKENRAQVREQVALKKDTTPLEREIRTIERKSNRSKQDEAELERLRTEVQRIKEIKEDFIRKNPDQRRTVVGYEKTDEEREAERQQRASAVASSSGIGTGLGGIGGRNPKWSVYYDPVFNPYGAPPPGMPYLEKREC